jgi:hypothetical protein
MPGNFQVRSQKILCKKYKLGKDFLEFKNIILEEKLPNKFKNAHGNFSGNRVPMVFRPNILKP